MDHVDTERLRRAADSFAMLRAAIQQAMVGPGGRHRPGPDRAGGVGHVLIEGVPGLGKTLLVRAMAQALSLAHARVQFTPDMMPSDITGIPCSIPSTRELRIVRGPAFTHILLADEINRAPAKTQSALLEAMQEYQVTIEGQTMPLPKPFMVLGDAEPVETEGTYPLPEAQLDRFLFKIQIGYPTAAEEAAVVIRVTADQAGDALPLADVKPCLDGAGVAALHSTSRGCAWTNKSWTTPSASSARPAITPAWRSAADRVARWRSCAAPAPLALLDGRSFATPDDVKRSRCRRCATGSRCRPTRCSKDARRTTCPDPRSSGPCPAPRRRWHGLTARVPGRTVYRARRLAARHCSRSCASCRSAPSARGRRRFACVAAGPSRTTCCASRVRVRAGDETRQLPAAFAIA
jgi:MoxR-like ATPase